MSEMTLDVNKVFPELTAYDDKKRLLMVICNQIFFSGKCMLSWMAQKERVIPRTLNIPGLCKCKDIHFTFIKRFYEFCAYLYKFLLNNCSNFCIH